MSPAPNHRRIRIRRVGLALIAALGALLAGTAARPRRTARWHRSRAASWRRSIRHQPASRRRCVDGDLRMWLKAPASATVTVLDYRGAPYLRFSRAGVEVNQNSAMYYLNQTPVAALPPTNLTLEHAAQLAPGERRPRLQLARRPAARVGDGGHHPEHELRRQMEHSAPGRWRFGRAVGHRLARPERIDRLVLADRGPAGLRDGGVAGERPASRRSPRTRPRDDGPARDRGRRGRTRAPRQAERVGMAARRTRGDPRLRALGAAMGRARPSPATSPTSRSPSSRSGRASRSCPRSSTVSC